MLNAAWWAGRELWWRADTARALQIMGDVLDRWPLDSIPVLDRPYTALATVFARAGQPGRAREYLSAYEETNEIPNRDFRLERHEARGRIALAEGRAADAIAEYRLADQLDGCTGCRYTDLALAYEQLGQPDSAIAFYERYVNTPGLFKAISDSQQLAHAYERLGQLYEARGDAQRSIYYYGKLITLWEDADSELQPRVEAARRAVRAQSPDR